MLVWICSSPFLMDILLMFVTPCFPRDDVISSAVAKINPLLLITPLGVFSRSCGYALHLVVWKLFILGMFSTCLWPFHHEKQASILCFPYVFVGSSSCDNFSIMKRENLAWQTSSKDSITMNLKNSAASFSESDSDRFRILFVCLLEDAIRDVYFSLALCSPTLHGVQLVLGIYQERSPFALLDTEIHDQYT